MITLFSLSFLLLFVDLTSLPSIVVMMIFMGSIIFCSIWSASGSCWFPVILALLFVGGVLVVFMVVSCLYPNTKNLSRVLKKKVFLLLFLIFILYSTPHFSFFGPLALKYSITTGNNFASLTFLILCYFFCFLYLISKDKISLRSFS